MPSPSYFEDFEIGAIQEFGEYEVTQEEILEFAKKNDPQPCHLSDAWGRRCTLADIAPLGGKPVPWLSG